MYCITFLIIETFKKSEITVVSRLTSLSFSHAPSLSEVAIEGKRNQQKSAVLNLKGPECLSLHSSSSIDWQSGSRTCLNRTGKVGRNDIPPVSSQVCPILIAGKHPGWGAETGHMCQGHCSSSSTGSY